ncbi:MAG: rod-determining factor RdfA [Halodesulfurarchaeum sp.]
MAEGISGCKIDVLTERYDLTSPDARYETFDDYLLARWTGTADLPGEGYQSLTDYINKRLLKQTYEAHGRDTLAPRLESEYDVLTGDDELLKQELIDDLAADGIDADRLVTEFVSRSTTRRHLKDCLGGDKKPVTARTEWERRSVEIALDRAEQKVVEAITSLESKGEFPGLDEVDIDIDVYVSCSECPTQLPLQEALDRGYVCDVHHEPPEQSSPTNAFVLLLVLSFVLPILSLLTAVPGGVVV